MVWQTANGWVVQDLFPDLLWPKLEIKQIYIDDKIELLKIIFPHKHPYINIIDMGIWKLMYLTSTDYIQSTLEYHQLMVVSEPSLSMYGML